MMEESKGQRILDLVPVDVPQPKIMEIVGVAWTTVYRESIKRKVQTNQPHKKNWHGSLVETHMTQVSNNPGSKMSEME